MSDSALAVYTAISPNCNRPRSQPISKITVHHMAGNTTLEAFGALVGKTSRQMSANYAIESSGRIGLFCHEADRSCVMRMTCAAGWTQTRMTANINAAMRRICAEQGV